MKAKTRDGRELDLVLYKFDSCLFCKRVDRVVRRLGVPMDLRDTRRDAAAARELVRVGGDDQVPCLFVDGKPMYESADIIEFLEENFG